MRHRFKRLSSLACGLSALATAAAAQLPQVGGYKDAANAPQLGIGVGVFGLDSNTGLRCAVGSTSTCQVPTGGTFTASLSGFRPVAYATPITATTSGVTGTLPAGAQVVATDTDASNPVYCALGASASTSSQYIAPGGGWFGFAVSGDTQLTCITATGTAKVNIAGGTGLPTGTGGGGGGGGGNVNLTQVNSSATPTGAGAASTAGTQRVAVAQDTTTIGGSAPGTAGTPSANVLTVQGPTSGGTSVPVADASVLAAVQASIPPGSALIGKVGVDQTTPGTTNGVQTLSGSVTTATLGAGSALAGKFGIDQTTPATTNAVAIKGTSGGTQTQVCTDTVGVLCSPQASNTGPVITKTNLSANTSTTICPTMTNPVSEEILFTTAGVGISLSGGTLTQAAAGTTAGTTPDLAFGTAGTLYTLPVPRSNAITAYGAAGIVVCIQNARQ